MLFPLHLSHVFLYTMLLKKVQNSSINEKAEKYQTAILVRIAILEGACLFSIVAFLLTAQYFYMIIFAAVFILILLYKPGKFRYQEEMEER